MTGIENKSFKKRILVLLSAVLSIIIVSAAFITIRTASATDYGDDGWEFSGVTGEWTREIEGSDYNEILNVVEHQHSQLDSLDELFRTEGPTEANGGNPSLMWSLMEAGNSPVRAGRSAITAIGVVLVMMYGIFEMFKALKTDTRIPAETLLRILAMCVLGMMLVIYIYDILTVIEKLGGIITDGIHDSVVGYQFSTVSYERRPETIETTLQPGETLNIFEQIVGWIRTTILNTVNWFSDLWYNIRSSIYSWFVRGLMNIALQFTFYAIVTSAYGLLFEMVIRKMFMPIAVADMIAEGVRSPAMRYLKNYFGIYIRIGMYYVIVQLLVYMEYWAGNLANHGTAWSINTFLGPIGVCICARTAAKALMNATGALTKEILGG